MTRPQSTRGFHNQNNVKEISIDIGDIQSEVENRPSSDFEGMIPRAIDQILELYQNFNEGFISQHFELKASFLEIYNDNI